MFRAAILLAALTVFASPASAASIQPTHSPTVQGLAFKGPTRRDFPAVGKHGVFPVSALPITLTAPVQFPDGATVTSIEVAAWRDPSSSRTLVVALREFCDSSATCTDAHEFPTIAVSGSGYTRNSAVAALPLVNNRVRLHTLTATFAGSGTPDTLQLISVRVNFDRNVTPPPAEARYEDVPPALPSFQFIEAMAAADLGLPDCAPRRHCPNAAVTKGEFAHVFARAIGLFTYERKLPSRRRPVRPFSQAD